MAVELSSGGHGTGSGGFATEPRAGRSRAHPRLTRVRLAAGLAATVLTAAPLRGQCPDGTPPPCGGRQSARTPPPPSRNTVAVMYFDNLTRDSADAVLADGLTEEIISRLGDLQRLTVKSRYAVRRYRSAPQEPAALGRQLAVTWLVTGSLQRSGDRLRVRAELALAATGNRVWGQQYERRDGDVLAIISDIARNVAAGVAGSLLPGERSALAARPTANRVAYDHLLRGDVLLALRTPAAVRRALAEYESAARLDTSLTVAWAKLSVAYGVLVQRGWTADGRPPHDSLSERCIAAADRALALDSTSSDAWMASGYAAMIRDPVAWRGAERGFRRAVQLNARNAEAWHQLGDLLGAVGRGDEALDAYRAAVAAEPGRPVSLLSLAATLPPREALAMLDSVVALDPSVNAFAIRATRRLAAGDSAGARSDAAALERVVPPGAELGSHAVAGRLALSLGDTAVARRLVDALVSELPAHGPVHQRIAGLVAALMYDLGEHAAALDLLERAPRGVGLWQNRAGARWQEDDRIRRVFEASRPPWAQ